MSTYANIQPITDGIALQDVDVLICYVETSIVYISYDNAVFIGNCGMNSGSGKKQPKKKMNSFRKVDRMC